MSRWTPLYATSPSGKTLFVCRMCGRITPLPDKECSVLPVVSDGKAAMTCSLLEEIEESLIEVGEIPKQEGIELWIHWDEENRKGVVQWGKYPGRGGMMHRADVVVIPKTKNTERAVVPRTPEGHINNCSLAHGEDEATCQICNGNCPDRELFK